MIRKLRVRLIAVAMGSLFLVLALIISLLHYSNYRDVVRQADNMLSILRDAEDAPPFAMPWMQDAPDLPQLPERPDVFQPDFLTRGLFYVYATADENGAVLSSSAEESDFPTADYVSRALRQGGEKGFVGEYRFLKYEQADGTHFIFLSCEVTLSFARLTLRNSIFVFSAGYLLVLLLTVLLSRRIVKPVSESYEKQKRFITDAGHEIKTPLTILDADMEMLEMDVPENEWLQDMRLQTRRLAELTNDLIYLSRMEEQERLQMIAFPLSDTAAECAASFESVARTQNKRFSAEIQPMITLHGDPKSIVRLVNILLDNAVKYSPPGGSIRFSLTQQGKQARLTVENTVDSIAPQTLENMFDRFYRGDDARSGQTGYGIGLSIAKAIVNAHKGRITAASPDGKTVVITAVI